MDSYVKIRCSSEQRAAWERAAGLQKVSAWARDVLDSQASPTLREAAAGVVKVTGVEVPKELKDVIRTPSEAAAVAKHYERARAGQCRHGLVNCRVCQSGVYAG